LEILKTSTPEAQIIKFFIYLKNSTASGIQFLSGQSNCYCIRILINYPLESVVELNNIA